MGFRGWSGRGGLARAGLGAGMLGLAGVALIAMLAGDVDPRAALWVVRPGF